MNSLASFATEDPGLWRQLLAPVTDRMPKPALYLDRDGVVVEETGYLHRVADMRLIDGAAAIVRAANAREIPVVLVTNQSGVGRGYYGWPEFAVLQQALTDALAAAGARLDMVLACAYHADGKPPFDVPDHPWRKPRPGMLLAAAEALSLDLTRSVIVGDTVSDIEAGRNAGLHHAIHVATGHGARDRAAALALAEDGFAVSPADSVDQAVAIFTSYIG